jgi:hypothetical protein
MSNESMGRGAGYDPCSLLSCYICLILTSYSQLIVRIHLTSNFFHFLYFFHCPLPTDCQNEF